MRQEIISFKSLLTLFSGFLLVLSMAMPVQALTVRSNNVADVDYAEWFVTGRDYSTINVFEGADIFSLSTRDFSTVNLAGGEVNRLSTLGSSTANIYGGSVNSVTSWSDSTINIANSNVDRVWALGDSSVTLSNLTGLNSLYVSRDSNVIIEALDFMYEGDTLRGTWLNGASFSIQTGGRLAMDNITVVPIPAASWLFLSSIVGLGLVGRKRHLGKANQA